MFNWFLEISHRCGDELQWDMLEITVKWWSSREYSCPALALVFCVLGSQVVVAVNSVLHSCWQLIDSNKILNAKFQSRLISITIGQY